MANQWRNDQSGGNQATGRKAMPAKDPRANGPAQTDNGTGKGTSVPNLKRVPGA